MMDEALERLAVRSGGVYVDCTIGMAGHAFEIGRLIGPGGTLIGLDRDQDALGVASARLSGLPCKVRLVRAPFAELESVLDELGVSQADGFLFDLGVSSAQLDDPSRGFSFRADGPLDMRMDRTSDSTAADLVNSLSQEELADLIRRLGEERYARRIAKAIVRARASGPIDRTAQLAQLIASTVPAGYERGRINPATRTFQALRIAVNAELEQLERALSVACRRLSSGGRLVVISYHSLEDGVAKRTLKRAERGCSCPPQFPVCNCGGLATVNVLTRKPLRPTPGEVVSNPRARSAKMRVAEGL